ncbi:glycerate kinase [Vibrio sp. 10N.261.46.E12]|uniref:glycerate kinase n=1 Tax=unclassified Vibrio TaxID=2614977 RepID=UPI0009762B49|nr:MULTISPECIES: glycerate kinase [unclassified Vibrio]OMO35921.1 glycerate kinase [Vibrio sp. 10N.261.45.E1]PMJ28582.1 glycerate kinase [Vibrio sp. 10N.286.45.B6]PML98620.1 glycerate kinase [Vibrio sp. 10N.261.49.E11]PMM68289.1 glycerate kinase [Vibrio sp. 10N.261.46.F12]PMM83094.1 glycerate kinase [Vibrio sp. 10N.261.46.E8]
MKIIIAPDSFKESLSAVSVAACIEKGFREIFPDAEYVALPLADGGEGTVDVLLQGLAGQKRTSQVEGPLGTLVRAEWAMLESSDSNPNKTALVEIAAASGLDLLAPEQRNPLVASSFGTGQLILEAIKQGVQTIILGLGGSATNDGGAGIVQALGGCLLDSNGQELGRGGAALKDLASIDLSGLDSRCADIDLIVACDVDNPLCGDKGASHIFGPQKGATPEQVVMLDKALANFAQVAETQGCVSGDVPVQNRTGYGAAGGAPMGLGLLFNMQIKPGIEMVLDVLQADDVLKGADLVITGEGQMDNQTLQGKTPYGIAKRASLQGIPTIGIAGSLGTEVEALYGEMSSLFGTVRSSQTLDKVLQEADINLIRTARNIAATLRLGHEIFQK